MTCSFSSWTLATAVLATTTLAACSSESPTSIVVDPPGPGTSAIQFDFSFIEAIKDCDGIEGDGDFSFQVKTIVSSGGSNTVYSSSRTLGDGDRTPAIGRRTYTVPATDGQQVTVEFIATEFDKNIFGKSFNDDRLSGARRTTAHKFNNGKWSGTGPQSITLGSGDCQVRLRYTVNAV